MLITSRETQRWVIPKGNLIKGLSEHEAAAQEAYEEAGIEGVACSTPIGRYHYLKRRKSGDSRTMTVEVYPLAVTGRADEWPEQDERTCAWFSIDQAAEAVDEPELKTIITGFREPPPLPTPSERPAPASHESVVRRRSMVGWLRSLLSR